MKVIRCEIGHFFNNLAYISGESNLIFMKSQICANGRITDGLTDGQPENIMEAYGALDVGRHSKFMLID